jgi:hypothetical protein
MVGLDFVAVARVTPVGQGLITSLSIASVFFLADALPAVEALALGASFAYACSIAYTMIRGDPAFRPSPWGLILASGPSGVSVLRTSATGRPSRLLASLPGASTQEIPRRWPLARRLIVRCPDGTTYRFESLRGWQ